MKQSLPGILLSLLLFSAASAVYSQDKLNPIQTVVPFLTIAPDSRAGAMGDAGVATSPDVFSNHWNPAKFAYIEGKGGVGISYSPWLRNLVPDINIAYLSGYYRIDKKQVLSSSLIYSSLGRVKITDDYGTELLDINPNELAFDLGYSRKFAEKFSGGVAFRFIYSNITQGVSSGGEQTYPGISFAADISGYYRNNVTLFSKDAEVALGLNFSNIGSKMSYTKGQTSDFIPMNMRLGGAGTLNFDEYNKMTLTLDLNKLLVPTPPEYDGTTIVAGKDPNVSVPVAIFQSFYDAPGGFREEIHEITYSFGAEYWYNNQFAIRGGYFHENQWKGNRKFFTAGAGFKLKGFNIDFSYLMPTTSNHPLARTLRFSLSFDSNSFRKSGISE